MKTPRESAGRAVERWSPMHRAPGTQLVYTPNFMRGCGYATKAVVRMRNKLDESMEAWKDSRIEGWKDESPRGIEGWDGPSRPP